jgi:hypothetical protein
MATKRKITKQTAKKIAVDMGINFKKDFHSLSSTHVSDLLAIAKMQGYKKPKTASGSTGRYYFEYLSKVK